MGGLPLRPVGVNNGQMENRPVSAVAIQEAYQPTRSGCHSNRGPPTHRTENIMLLEMDVSLTGCLTWNFPMTRTRPPCTTHGEMYAFGPLSEKKLPYLKSSSPDLGARALGTTTSSLEVLSKQYPPCPIIMLGHPWQPQAPGVGQPTLDSPITPWVCALACAYP